MPGLFDLKGQIGFYAQYHHNLLNKLIHITCVPILLWTPMVWLARSGPLTSFPPQVTELADQYGLSPVANASFFLALFYGLYYIVLEPFAGTIAALLLLAGSYAATYVSFNVENAIAITVAVHIVSWALQFFGHFVFEKRAPALFDSLFQSLVLAPLFVWLELLFMVGYRPSLAKEIDTSAKKAIQEYRKSSKASKKH